MSANKSSFSAAKLRIVLIATIVLLVAVSAVGFWLFRTQMVNYAVEVNKATAEANASANDVRTLQTLKTKLEEDTVAITRTKNIVASSQFYQYQDQAISDLTRYAKAAGVTVSAYGFDGDKAAAATPDPAAAPVAPGPAGVKTTSVTVTLKSPLNYQALLRFIHAIERNLTKMQLTGISITLSPENPNMVSVNPLTVEIYTRQ